jgi:nitrate reductase alpha subunit
MAMGHVILTEFFRDRQVPYFTDYVKTYTDLPFLVTLREYENGYLPDRFLTAEDLGHTGEGAAHQTVLLDSGTGEPVLPNGTLASRFSEAGRGRWNLDLGRVDPVLTLNGRHEDAVVVSLPRFDVGETEGGGVIRRGVPVIMMGAGTNHWFHSDQIYRTFFTLTMLCGCQGVNGGGWAHYVGQEKVRPLTGFQQVAFALDWQRPTRHMTGTSFFYLHTDQWRYESFGAGELASPLGRGLFRGRAFADTLAQAARMGWTPSHPAFDRNPLDLADEAAAAGQSVGDYVVRELQAGRLRFAGEDPDNPANFPRVMTVWRANLLGSSGKGMEYFMRHLLGVDDAVRAAESPAELRPAEVRWHETAPRAKLDLVTTLDFRMTSTCTYSDIVLPAATWYEKHDISSTDMHPFVHSFNPAIAPPWDTRTDFDAFTAIAAQFSRLAGIHLGDELPDYLPMVLDFAALTDRGQRLLRSRRADLELLRRALAQADSPYADVVAAVCAQLPRLGRRELSQVLAAWESGPPREEVGLEPFAPPDYLAGYRAET